MTVGVWGCTLQGGPCSLFGEPLLLEEMPSGLQWDVGPQVPGLALCSGVPRSPPSLTSRLPSLGPSGQ